MPELPEVETVRRGLEPHLRGRRIRQVAVRDARLRWPVPDDLARKAEGRRIESLARRGKYLIVTLDSADRMIWPLDRKSGVWGTYVSGRVKFGGSRHIKTKTKQRK